MDWVLYKCTGPPMHVENLAFMFSTPIKKNIRHRVSNHTPSIKTRVRGLLTRKPSKTNATHDNMKTLGLYNINGLLLLMNSEAVKKYSDYLQTRGSATRRPADLLKRSAASRAV